MKKFAKTKTPDTGKERIIMSKNKLRERRLKKLKRGKIKSVGLFEAFKVWIVGRIDGIRGLPKKTDDGKLTSPWLNKQINAYEEFCCDTWGHLQVEDEEVYSRIDELADVVERTQQHLVHAKAAVERAQETENSIPVSRMEGEESLNDNQVRTRRSNEKG